MDFSACSQDGNINLYFVLPINRTQENCSACLICAYQACQEHDLEPKWLKTSDCLMMNPTKQDVFVCDPFNGDAYEDLLSGRYKCVRVLGPRCLLSCLRTKRPVPELPSPLHNIAMQELVVTSTGFDKDEKTEIQKMIEKMCGIYSNNFHDGITHLVAKAVGSKKYLVALEKEVPIMTKDWVTEVWNASNAEPIEEVSATEEAFVKYTCPIFLGLTICLSQVPRKEKEQLRKIIEVNGGTYASTLEMSVTSVVILPLPEGEKYKHANQWRIPCITRDWLLDSVESGHAVSMEGYKVEKRPKASTPTHETSVRVPDMSQCSTIMSDSIMCRKEIRIDETTDTEFAFERPGTPEEVAEASELDELNVEDAYKAGLFLDGCRVFVTGFSTALQEKLGKLVNSGGAIRSQVLNESLSHVVIGGAPEFSLSVMDAWTTKPHMVTANWLLESIKLRRPADESKFVYSEAKPESERITEKDHSLLNADGSETFLDEDILRQYLSASKLDDTVNVCEEQASQAGGIFSKKLLYVSGFNDEEHELLCGEITSNGGKIVDDSYPGIVDYSVVTLAAEGNLQMDSENFVTHLYIEDCLEQEAILPIEYYHLPFGCDQENLPLVDCVIATSIYKAKERSFLIHIIYQLGGNFQEMFAKKDAPSRGVKCSTHLVCPEPEGDKHKAACRWEIPVVTKDWLLQCIERSSRPPEQLFKVGVPPDQRINAFDVMMQAFIKFKNVDVSEDITADSICISATPAVCKAVKNLKEKQIEENIKTPDLETMRKMYPTPGRAMGNDSLDAMATPETPYGLTWHANPTSRVRKGFKRVIDSLADDKPAKRTPRNITTPESVYVRKIFDNIGTFLSQNSAPPKATLDEPAANVMDEEDVTVEQADYRGPLMGVVVYASQKLNDVQSELYATVVELGGEHVWTYSDKVTHFVHCGRINDTNREFRQARDKGKFIVSPDWVWMCRSESKLVDEGLFPHNHNPKMSLSIMSSKATPVRRMKPQKRTTKKTVDVAVSEDVEEADDENQAHALSRQLEEIDALANAASSTIHKRSSTRLLSKGSMSSPPKMIPVKKSGIKLDSESQPVAITWDDPQEREARQKIQISCSKDTQEILANLKMPDPTSDNTTSGLAESEESALIEENTDLGEEEGTSEDEEDVTQIEPKRSDCPHPVFIMSGMQDDDFGMYADVVASLGGRMAENRSYLDDEVTHIVTVKPTRSEKHLAGIAAGRWLLYKSFFDCSMDAGYFVHEEAHEWGSPLNDLLQQLDQQSIEAKLAKAAHRWRASVDESGHRAFHSMIAVIYTTSQRTVSFTRLIEAGGGAVMNIKSTPAAEDLGKITHCLVEINRRPDIDLKMFATTNIPCLSPIYLHSFLTSDTDPIDDVIPEYKAILDQMS